MVVPPQQDSGEVDASLSPGELQCEPTRKEIISNHQACESDDDCMRFKYQAACCMDVQLVGVDSTAVEHIQRCLDEKKPVCSCEPGLTRTDDGRVVTVRSQTGVECIDQRCTSRVTQRQCGSKRVCGPKEICVTYENSPGTQPDPDSGDNAYLTFRCEPNPCPDKLDCDCAQPMCDAYEDSGRRCEIKNNEESDLTCSRFAD